MQILYRIVSEFFTITRLWLCCVRLVAAPFSMEVWDVRSRSLLLSLR